jgi:FKBP-type peptidyl-prolyl cis-trans isomerase FklB
MKFKCAAVLGVLFLVGLVNAEENVVLKDQKDRANYSIGVNIGNNLKNLPVGVDLDLLLKGIKDVLTGTKLLMTEQEIRETMMTLQKETAAKSEEQRKVLGGKNKKEGEEFLAENKKKEGITSLPSGLQYKVLKAGTGKTPKDTDTVFIHFRGALMDGTEFQNTYKSFERPLALSLNGPIPVPGWTEALKLMQEGAKWQLFIPPHLAFGERGSGTLIGPNATLIFEVELISIQEKK